MTGRAILGWSVQGSLLVLGLLATRPAAGAGAAEVPAELAWPDCVGCTLDAEEIRRGYPAVEWQALEAGEILVVQDEPAPGQAGRHGGAAASGLFESPPEQVWSVLVDYDSWPDFLESNRETRLLRTEGNRAWVFRESTYLLLSIRHTLVNTLSPRSGRIDWALDPTAENNDIAEAEGFYELVPVDGGRRTLMRYHGRIDAGRQAPRFIEGFLTRRTLPAFYRQLGAEVTRRFPRRTEVSAGGD
jgi:hypothetical protein